MSLTHLLTSKKSQRERREIEITNGSSYNTFEVFFKEGHGILGSENKVN